MCGVNMTERLYMQRNCSTCALRSMPDDVDFNQDPCETCALKHIDPNIKPWPLWRPREAEQFRADARAGHKVKIKLSMFKWRYSV